MAACTYKLRSSLRGHSMDVRAVTVGPVPEGCIVSGSRDHTAKVWIPNSFDSNYAEVQTFKGHENFISCVCVTVPDEKYPKGLILTGSNDTTICAFSVDFPQPVFKLSGHSSTVCCLAAGKFGTILSGSWDQTARVWLNHKCLMTLSGHEAAVWAVALLPESGLMLTGSADHTIRMWKAGTCHHIFKGHTDCVRALAVLSSKEFLSCSNDATIRHWLLIGECIGTYYGHSNFIYSLAVLPNTQDFVTSGEDRTVRVWQNGECKQTIFLPAQSIWSVACLPNGDIVTGSSDGVVRIFTTAAERCATPEEQTAFEAEVAGSTLSAQQELGGMKISELPGPEGLYEPGKRDGQTVMIREGSTVMCYSWSAAENQWKKIGEVVGANEATQNPAGKKIYEGKEYDYVLDVEIEDAKVPLKLPFNITEDPWFVAQKFINKHNLSQLYLDQIANFIVDNTKGMSLGPAPGSSQYADPFTGSGRYIPGSTDAGPTTSSGGTKGVDPFTGAGKYEPTDSVSAPSTSRESVPANVPAGSCPVDSYVPQMTCLRFDQANAEGILGKLKEFHSKLSAPNQRIDEELLPEVMRVVHADTSPGTACIQAMRKMLQWPKDMVFPVLDILRLAVRNKQLNTLFCTGLSGIEMLNYLLQYFSSEIQPANQMLAVRTVCNMFCHKPGENLVLSQRDLIITRALNLLPPKHRNIQVALSTLLLNYAVVLHNQNDIEANSHCISVIPLVLEGLTDGEAQFRTLVCIGTLVWENKNGCELAKSLDLLPLVQQLKGVLEPEKVSVCAAEIERLLL